MLTHINVQHTASCLEYVLIHSKRDLGIRIRARQAFMGKNSAIARLNSSFTAGNLETQISTYKLYVGLLRFTRFILWKQLL